MIKAHNAHLGAYKSNKCTKYKNNTTKTINVPRMAKKENKTKTKHESTLLVGDVDMPDAFLVNKPSSEATGAE